MALISLRVSDELAAEFSAFAATPDEHEALRAIVRELNRIGGNINQIARAANTSVLQGRAVEPDLSEIKEARSVIETELARLRNALHGNADY